MSCLLRLPTPLKSNFKALFSSRNRLRALIDAILLLDSRCHIGHKNANCLHAHGSACTLVAGTQDVALAIAAIRHSCYHKHDKNHPNNKVLFKYALLRNWQYQFFCLQYVFYTCQEQRLQYISYLEADSKLYICTTYNKISWNLLSKVLTGWGVSRALESPERGGVLLDATLSS